MLQVPRDPASIQMVLAAIRLPFWNALLKVLPRAGAAAARTGLKRSEARRICTKGSAKLRTTINMDPPSKHKKRRESTACGRFSIKSNAHFASIVFLCFAGGSPFVVVINIINLALPCGQGLATFAEEDNEGGINVAKPLPLFPLFPVLHRPTIHSGTIIDAFK